jgi:hypothetical protein
VVQVTQVERIREADQRQQYDDAQRPFLGFIGFHRTGLIQPTGFTAFAGGVGQVKPDA